MAEQMNSAAATVRWQFLRAKYMELSSKEQLCVARYNELDAILAALA